MWSNNHILIKTKHLIILTTASLLLSCNDSQKENASGTVISIGKETTELPLPSPPESMSDPAERAAFIAERFWDSLDFCNDPLALDTAFMEQNFANFISILSIPPREQAAIAVDKLVRTARQSPQSADLLDFISGKYLDDPNSPMRDEEIYILFLEAVLKLDSVSTEKEMRARYRLNQALKNRRGTIAADFRFNTADGKETTLLKSLGDRLTMLMFYDPECPQCTEIKDRLKNTDIAPDIKIIAVDIAGDRETWIKNISTMPDSWEIGFATDNIDDDEIYVIPALPVFYLLDSIGTVILKDPPPEMLIR